MNSPLGSGYYEAAAADRLKLYQDMEKKIQGFFNGIAGTGPVINEPLLTGTVIGIPENTEQE